MVSTLLSEIMRRMNSAETHAGYYFDLSKDILVNQIKFSLKIRPFCPKDIPELFYSSVDHLTHDEIRERLQRLLFISADIPTGYVAVDAEQTPYALCWLIYPSENEIISDYFANSLPNLKSDEVLLEFVFIHPNYRGNRLMEWISKQLFIKAKSVGSKRAIAFIREKNKISSSVANKIGWEKFIKKKIKWNFFKKSVRYELLNFN